MANRIEGTIEATARFPVYYEDTDLSGFVYHANYLKYFERAREHLIGLDFLSRLHMERGIHFVVSRANLTYKYPARHGDSVLVHSAGRYSSSPAIDFVQTAWLLENGQQTRELVTGEITIVSLNKDNFPVRMPDDVVQYFAARYTGNPTGTPG